ncbi:hypothetical protein [Neptunitalea lumnitzerae]|uniref:Uncharacterized protein n=1 Tax=Neptunitalea lumnitzerae TaxID=2965509 RepID=A0ABQ5MG19_9FLAO|nr:hypothetical protein [Neptunitalea sp. Y10]GLB47847.1 hypothetical protein Y10_02150 [Neptunitalea sp. Y10]
MPTPYFLNLVSTLNLGLLSSPADLEKTCKSLAVLEAIICPEWKNRYCTFEIINNESLFHLQNEQGDHMCIWFTRHGVLINGFAMESTMNGWRNKNTQDKYSVFKLFKMGSSFFELKKHYPMWKGLTDNIPEELHNYIYKEPIKSLGTTFCIWQANHQNSWQTGNIELPNDDIGDGSEELLFLVDGNADTYYIWATEYYDFQDLQLDCVALIYQHEPISKELLYQINSEYVSVDLLKKELDAIEYPHNL